MTAQLPYSREFFDEHREGARRSAHVLVPLIMELLHPESVVDVGCGTGVWLSVFRDHGVLDVLGIDGAYVARDSLDIDANDFLPHDLTEPLDIGRTFDLAISLEVAEHLPSERAARFVSKLTGLAPVIVFSAAIPDQDGTDHVNTQWPTYWRQQFATYGYDLIDSLRPTIWENESVDFWYRQNVLIFARPEVIEQNATLRAEQRTLRPLDIVHPVHWAQVMHQARIDRAQCIAASSGRLHLATRALARARRVTRRLLRPQAPG